MSQPILTIQVDAREFNQAAEELFKKSSRTYPEFVNGQLYGLALKALQQTEKASKAGIRAELGSGKDSLAARIINARLRRAGRKTIWGADLNAAVARMVAARTRAVAFTKSGWLWAIRELAQFVKSRPRRGSDAQIRGSTPKGSARPALPALSAVVTGSITNTAIREPEAMPVAEAGLVKALAIQAQDMRDALQRRIQKDIDSVK